DCTGKERKIEKALEDLKANFYCELCDKQYYKHQEFDNHINSYDHAHKQRLKELKHREFARNVASKSRKDEKKQEKALKRLHKLAELRKEAECAPGSGPMFKSTTVAVVDTTKDFQQSAKTDTVDKPEDQTYTVAYKTQNCIDVNSEITNESEGERSENSNLGKQFRGSHGQKIGFSFSFPKKASVKLESSAAVFYENSEEGSIELGFSQKSRTVPGACNLQATLLTEDDLSSNEKHNCIIPLVEKCSNRGELSQVQESNSLPGGKENNESELHFYQCIQPENFEVKTTHNHMEANSLREQTLLKDTITSNLLETTDLIKTQTAEEASSITEKLHCSLEEDISEENKTLVTTLIAHNDFKNQDIPSGVHGSSNVEDDSSLLQSEQVISKKQNDPFIPILSKDGSTILQWPSEMLLFTSTAPAISYSCNPLYFDFKSTKSKDSLEKSKVDHNVVMCNTEKNIEGFSSAHKQINQPRNYFNQTQTEQNEDSSIKEQIIDEGYVRLCEEPDLVSCMVKNKQKHRKSEQHSNSVRHGNKKNHELRTRDGKYFHKNRNRKRKKREFPSQHMQYMEWDKKLQLRTLEDSEDQFGDHWESSDVKQSQSPYKLDDDCNKRLKETEAQKQNNECSDCGSEKTVYRNENCFNSDNIESNNRTSHRQSHQSSVFLKSHRGHLPFYKYKREVKTSKSTLEHKFRGHYNSEKCFYDSYSTKRGIDSLLDEIDGSHPKRRLFTHTSSTDGCSYRQSYALTKYGSHNSCSNVECKPKKKRKRKRIRGSHCFTEIENENNAEMNYISAESVNLLNTEPKKKSLQPENTVNMDIVSAAEQNRSYKSLFMKNNPTDSLPDVVYPESLVVEDCILPPATTFERTFNQKESQEILSIHEVKIPYKKTVVYANMEHCTPQVKSCHYETCQTMMQNKVNEENNEWLQHCIGNKGSQQAIQFKEAQIPCHDPIITEKGTLTFTPEQALACSSEGDEKYMNLQFQAYSHNLHQHMLANKIKLALPTTTVTPTTSLQPLPLQHQLSSTSVTTIHHTILQQHAAAVAACKFFQPHQQFLPQVPPLSRTLLPHVSLGWPPGHRPGPTLLASPQIPMIPATTLHPGHLTLHPLPHATLLPPLFSPHPAVISLQPLF
uniref:Zinc finger protein 804A n=1 Tax=Latimeria chalumnae TaxID=7897 RepID=H3B0Q4_LATCH